MNTPNFTIIPAGQTDLMFSRDNLSDQKIQPCPKFKLKTLKSRSFKDEPISKYLYFEEQREAKSEENRLPGTKKSVPFDPEPELTKRKTSEDNFPENPFLRARRSLMEKEKQKALKAAKRKSTCEQDLEDCWEKDRVTFRIVQKSQPLELPSQ